MMTLLDGKFVAGKYQERIKAEIIGLDLKPGLAVISIGEDAASMLYVKLKHKMCETLGIAVFDYHFDKDVSEEKLLTLIDELNEREDVHGILVQTPVPYHINILNVFNRISPEKDVDGFNPINAGRLSQGQKGLVPCTPLGVLHILEEYNIDIEGKSCVVVGRSNIVGRPMATLLINKNGTVTVCHSKTKNLGEITKKADILIVAIGRPKYITADMIKDGAVVVDVGVNRIPDTKKIYGDVDFENAKDKCSFISPVPGGIGPMTIITLMENVVTACKNQTLKK